MLIPTAVQLQNVATIIQSAISGYLPSGIKMKAATVAEDAISNTWLAPSAGLAGLNAYKINKYKVYGGRLGNSQIPNDRIMWQLGSLANAKPLILVSGQVNLIKGQLFDFAQNGYGIFMGKLNRALNNNDKFDKYLEAALKAGKTGINKYFQPIRTVNSEFNAFFLLTSFSP